MRVAISLRTMVALLGLVIFFVALNVWLAVAPVSGKNRPPSVSSKAVVQTAGRIDTISLEPSIRDAGWLMYQDGAFLVVTGSGLTRVTFFFYPTGSGVGEAYPNGQELGGATLQTSTPSAERWVFPMPKGVLATSLWAEATTVNGQTAKSRELLQIGYSETP